MILENFTHAFLCIFPVLLASPRVTHPYRLGLGTDGARLPLTSLHGIDFHIEVLDQSANCSCLSC